MYRPHNNNDKYFEKFITLREPVNIYLGDGRSIKATKIRNVVSYFQLFGNKNGVDMRNFYYAEEMNANLISYGKLMLKIKLFHKGM